MKKTYIQPSTQTMRVETPDLMEGSTLSIYGSTANEENKLLGRGRGRDIWDDEEE